MFNAFVIYSKTSQNKPRYKKFLLEVARKWISVDSNKSSSTPAGSISSTSKRAPYKDPPSRLSGKLSDHVLEQIVTGVKTNPTRRCRVCSSKGKRSEMRYVCKTCFVPLHAGDCHTVYHTKKNY